MQPRQVGNFFVFLFFFFFQNKLRCTEDEMTKLKIENENLKQEIKEFEKKEKSWEVGSA